MPPTMNDEEEILSAEEYPCTTYGVECPGCKEWHEHSSRMAGKIIDCTCGTKFKVKP